MSKIAAGMEAARKEMLKCESCGVEGADKALFCASCGAPLSGETLVTEGAEAPSPTPARIPSAPKPRSGSSSSSTNEGRFLPGALVAGRYRIVALLGKGGMGEVYRADDLTLGQQVALKFLKEATAKDEALLERFRNEVRTAREFNRTLLACKGAGFRNPGKRSVSFHSVPEPIFR